MARTTTEIGANGQTLRIIEDLLSDKRRERLKEDRRERLRKPIPDPVSIETPEPTKGTIEKEIPVDVPTPLPAPSLIPEEEEIRKGIPAKPIEGLGGGDISQASGFNQEFAAQAALTETKDLGLEDTAASKDGADTVTKNPALVSDQEAKKIDKGLENAANLQNQALLDTEVQVTLEQEANSRIISNQIANERKIDFQLEELKNKKEDREAAIQDELDITDATINSFELEPARFFNQKSTGQRITTAIAIFLGGLGGGQNKVLDLIERNIDRDIKAQQSELLNLKGIRAGQFNMLKNVQDSFENTRTSFLKTKLQMFKQVDRMIDLEGTKTTNAFKLAQLRQVKAAMIGKIALAEEKARKAMGASAKLTGLKGNDRKSFTFATEGLLAVRRMRAALLKGNFTNTPFTNDFTLARGTLEQSILREDSGAALSESEKKDVRALIPGFFSGFEPFQLKMLRQLEEKMINRLRSLDFMEEEVIELGINLGKKGRRKAL